MQPAQVPSDSKIGDLRVMIVTFASYLVDGLRAEQIADAVLAEFGPALDGMEPTAMLEKVATATAKAEGLMPAFCGGLLGEAAELDAEFRASGLRGRPRAFFRLEMEGNTDGKEGARIAEAFPAGEHVAVRAAVHAAIAEVLRKRKGAA